MWLHRNAGCLGSLDRCVEGETARIILSSVDDTPQGHSPQQASPLQLRSLSTGENSPPIQVLLFDPHQLIMRLTKLVASVAPDILT